VQLVQIIYILIFITVGNKNTGTHHLFRALVAQILFPDSAL